MEGKPLALAVLLTGASTIALGVWILHVASTPSPSPKQPDPAPPLSVMINSEQRFSVLYYKALIEDDARAFAIDAPSYEELAQPNPYFDGKPPVKK